MNLNFKLINKKTNQFIYGCILNREVQSKVVFFTSLIEDISFSKSIIHSPTGFLFSYVNFNSFLVEKGYDVLMFEGSNQEISLILNPTFTLYYDSDGRAYQSKNEKTIKSVIYPKDFQYTKNKDLNKVLAKNKVSLNNLDYKKNKNRIHRYIHFLLNQKSKGEGSIGFFLLPYGDNVNWIKDVRELPFYKGKELGFLILLPKYIMSDNTPI